MRSILTYLILRGMSRVGKKILALPAGVSVDIRPQEVAIKGPKGELVEKVHPRVRISKTADGLTVGVVNENDTHDRALWGTFASILENMIIGVTEGYKKQLEVNGVGYKVSMKGPVLNLEVGYSHPVEVTPLPSTKVTVEKNIITIEGANKQQVGEMAAQIRAIKKPEPYKGKGIKYATETIRRKAGKTAAKSA